MYCLFVIVGFCLPFRVGGAGARQVRKVWLVMQVGWGYPNPRAGAYRMGGAGV